MMILTEKKMKEVVKKKQLRADLWLGLTPLGQVVLQVLQAERARKALLVHRDHRELLDPLVFPACQVQQDHFLTFNLTSTGSKCLRG